MHVHHSLLLLAILGLNTAAVPHSQKRATPLGSYIVKGGKLPKRLQQYQDESQWMEQKYGAQTTCTVPKAKPAKQSDSFKLSGGTPSTGTHSIASFFQSAKSKLMAKVLNKRARPNAGVDKQSGHMIWVNLEIGSSQSVIPVMLDTGSHELLIPETTCEECAEPQFDPDSSETFVATKQTVELAFLDGCEMGGYVAYDTVGYVAPQSGASLQLPHQAFIAITDDYRLAADQSLQITGLLGLDLSVPSETNQPTFLNNLVANGLIDRAYFSTYFALPDSDGNERSSVCFGCVEYDKIEGGKSGHIEWVPLVPGGKTWTVSSAGMRVEGENSLSTGAFDAVIDTGASLIYLPFDIANHLWNNIPGAFPYDNESWGFPCGTVLPSIYIGFGKQQYRINPERLNMGPITKDKKTCLGTIWGKEILEYAVVGGIFLVDRVVVYDQDAERIGFASGVDSASGN